MVELKMTQNWLRIFVLSALCLVLGAGASAYIQSPAINMIARTGGRLDWSPRNVIAYDRLNGPRSNKNTRYDIWLMTPDGAAQRSLTANRDRMGLPHGEVGQPTWHPLGRFLAVQAEKEVHPPVLLRVAMNPGAGVYNDLWVIDMQTRRAHALHEVPTNKNSGILHPHFSFDGTRIAWSEMYKGASLIPKNRIMGYWKLKVADFVFDGVNPPSLANIREYEPDGPGFYENHGFSPDGRLLIFTHNTANGDPFKTNNICTMDLATGRMAQQLTDRDYNEHGSFSPDGKRVAWMTSADLGGFKNGTEFWVMNSDGSDKRRLTYFNTRGHDEFIGTNKVVAADLCWSPDSREIMGYVQVRSIPFGERIYRIAVPH